MVGSGHPAHDTGATWTLLSGDRLGAWIDADIQHRCPPQPAAWYNKRQPTFSDAIAAVRRVLWSPPSFPMSRSGSESTEIPVTLLNRFVELYVSPPEMRKVELWGRTEPRNWGCVAADPRCWLVRCTLPLGGRMVP